MLERIVCIAMINDGINGRMPFAYNMSLGGKDKPGESFAEYELRMYYHEAVLPPRFPVPAIPLRVVVGDDYMYDTLYIETADDSEDPIIVALWDFNFDRCMDFNTPLGEYQYFGGNNA